MSFKPFFRALAAALVLATAASIAAAQTTQVSGTVKLKQADGTEVPLAGATVDIYRTDIKGEFHVKTDKKGRFMHAGIPFTGTYTLIISGPGARPDFATGLRFTTTQERNFTLEPGDGSKLTLEQVRSAAPAPRAAAGAAAPSESKEDKAKREEMERKIKELEAKNAEITKSNETIKASFDAGNTALKANNLDEAIRQYQQGLAARPDEPALLTNLSEALRRRGVNRYNEALKATPPDTAGMDAAKKDWTEAAAASQKAYQLLSAAPADPAQAAGAGQSQNRVAAVSTRALAMRLVATKVDQSQAQAAWDAYQEYINTEADPAKKARLRGEALQTVFDAGNMDMAVTQARALLAEDAENVDANRILGLALFAGGDKAKFQEAANYLQRYVDKAPDTDPLKMSAKESLDYLKTAENVKPEKSAPARPARRRP